jgi:hypothetical protein
MYLKVICAWCGKFMRMKECKGSGVNTLPVSHSICAACSIKLEDEMEEVFQQNPKPTEEEECHERQG